MSDIASELESTLDEILLLLRLHGEEHWGNWLARDLALIRAGDRGGVEHLLSAYGGMGSFSDLLLCPENGHRIAHSEVDAANETLRRLSARAWDLARAILRAV